MKDFRVGPLPKARAQANRQEWYRIVNKSEDSVRIDIYETIGYDPWWDEGVDSKKFIKDLNELTVSTIELHINSPGGFVPDAIAMYNALRDHEAEIVVTVDALAASAASVIAMAGDRVIMNRNAEVMVHDPSWLVFGNAEDMREAAEFLDRVGANLASIYAARCGGTVAEWRDVMLAETWFSAEEAVKAGLADEVVEDQPRQTQKAKNRFDLSIFDHAGREKAPAPKIAAMHSASGESRPDSVLSDAQSGPQEGAGMTPAQLEQIGLPEDASEDDINAKLAEAAAALAAQNSDTSGDGGDGEGEDDGEGTDGPGRGRR
jgi:ATP-dependent protease ClpP protease subunit